jgi:hypothetical protein
VCRVVRDSERAWCLVSSAAPVVCVVFPSFCVFLGFSRARMRARARLPRESGGYILLLLLMWNYILESIGYKKAY